MSCDYKYNGKEYENSFGCSFPTISMPEEYNFSYNYEIVFIKDTQEHGNDFSSKDIGSRLLFFCKDTAKWFIKKIVRNW